MQTVDEEPIETLHIYVVREAAPKPSLLPIFLSVMALYILLAFGVLSPKQQPVQRTLLRVPAVFLPVRSFTAVAPVIPTGVKTYPATIAHGILTITNGSIISQTIPQGFRLENVITDRAVFVPAGSANGYGVATVPAHVLVSGKSGNIPAYAINQVVGSSVYIRNLAAIRGGKDAYSIKFVTVQDKQAALTSARQHLSAVSTGLHYPCLETIHGSFVVTWRCQMLTYHIAAFYHVTCVRLAGRSLLVDVWFIPRVQHIQFK